METRLVIRWSLHFPPKLDESGYALGVVRAPLPPTWVRDKEALSTLGIQVYTQGMLVNVYILTNSMSVQTC